LLLITLSKATERAVESELQMKSKKRGGAKKEPVHLGLLLLSTILLTVAGLLMVYGYNVMGVLAMLLGIGVRVLDMRI
jgi:hypothetical protein